MDFLKKHYEKIALAVALIALIVSAIWLSLKINALNSELASSQTTPQPKREASPQLNLQAYSNAIVMLKAPPLWTNAPTNPFGPTLDVRTPDVTNETTFPVILMSVGREPFKLLFKAYSYDADKKEGYNFQINFQFRARKAASSADACSSVSLHV